MTVATRGSMTLAIDSRSHEAAAVPDGSAVFRSPILADSAFHSPLHKVSSMHYVSPYGQAAPALDRYTLDIPATPLTAPPPPQVMLTDAPLVRVIAQVRYPLIASIEKREFIAAFQESIRKDYPVLRPELGSNLVLGPGGVMSAHSDTTWRFEEVDGPWRVSLAPGFLALETRKYTNRDDFVQRLRHILHALRENIRPDIIDRLGIRYIDRVSGENLQDLEELVRPEVIGILSTTLAGNLHQAIAEHVFTLPEGIGQVIARWCWIPAQVTVDPTVVDVLDEPSWLLDIDAFRAEAQPFDVDEMANQVRRFAETIYGVFRWAVTDEFLRRYGGEV